MQRQAVPLIYAQKPIVGTGLESLAILDSSMVIKSYCEGTVAFFILFNTYCDDLGQMITYYLRNIIVQIKKHVLINVLWYGQGKKYFQVK